MTATRKGVSAVGGRLSPFQTPITTEWRTGLCMLSLRKSVDSLKMVSRTPD
jgi:hypothetical protein